MALIKMPMIILKLSNSAFSEIMVVSVPAPANNGKAIGTMLPEVASPFSSLNNLIPRIISRPIKNITNEPAKAKEDISIPNRPSIEAPANKKVSIIIVAKLVTIDGLNTKPSFFMVINTGMFPSISITENRIKVTDNTAVKFIFLSFRFFSNIKPLIY